MAKPRFAYLLLKEHPYGRGMLKKILSENFIPEIIIQEDSKTADEERNKFIKRIERNDIAPTIEEQAMQFGIRVVSVSIHKSKQVIPFLEGLDLEEQE